MKQTYKTLSLTPQDDHVLLVTLNRPDVLNAMNTQLGLDLVNLFEFIAMSPGLLRCIALTGSGKDFCAGRDLKQRNAMSSQDWTAQHVVFERSKLQNCRIERATVNKAGQAIRVPRPSHVVGRRVGI